MRTSFISYSRRGLTLIEVMVSLALLAGIGTVVYSALGMSFIARDAFEADDAIRTAGQAAMTRITRELQLAWLTDNFMAINTYRTVFVGEDADPVDKIWFSSLSHHRIYRDARECDQTEITLWAEDDPTEQGDYVLLHRESPRVDHEPDEDGEILPLVYGVKRFDLKYLDPSTNEWVNEWNSVEGGAPGTIGTGGVVAGSAGSGAGILPRAVRVILVLEGPDPEDPDKTREVPFVTTVMLEYANSIQMSALATGTNSIPMPATQSAGSAGRSLPFAGGL
jgi:general secretion pathway protein J